MEEKVHRFHCDKQKQSKLYKDPLVFPFGLIAYMIKTAGLTSNCLFNKYILDGGKINKRKRGHAGDVTKKHFSPLPSLHGEFIPDGVDTHECPRMAEMFFNNTLTK